jgi:hypothetical protein
MVVSLKKAAGGSARSFCAAVSAAVSRAETSFWPQKAASCSPSGIDAV